MADAILVSDWVEEHYGAQIGRLAPSRPRVVVGPDACEGDPAAAAVCFFSGDLFPERTVPFLRQMVRAKQLQWFHSFSAGVDNPFFQGLLERGIRLSTSAGAHAVPIAHTVLLYLLALSRDLPGWLDAQRDHRWEPRDVQDLQGQRMLVVGMGPIGVAVARLALALGMDVVGLRRTPRGDEPCDTRPLAELDDLLPTCDALVLAIPLAPETHHLIDAARLAKLKEGAVLLNVARGDIVDEPALIGALESGRLAGAGLDVFHEEPLPKAKPALGHAPRHRHAPQLREHPGELGPGGGNLPRQPRALRARGSAAQRGDAGALVAAGRPARPWPAATLRPDAPVAQPDRAAAF